MTPSIRFTTLIANQPVTKTLNARLEKIRDYPTITYWVRQPVEIPADLETFYRVLTTVAENQQSCIVTGDVAGPLPLDRPARRLKYPRDGHPETLAEPIGSNWFVVDVDAVETGVEIDPNDPDGQVSAVLGLMGDEFAGVSCIWQVSSSACPFNTSARLRLWFITDAPLDNPQRDQIAQAINRRAGLKLIDPALFRATQPIYVAPPIIEGGADPFLKRFGILHDERETLAIAPLLALTTRENTRQATHTPRATGGLREILEAIGDHPTGRGIHAPVTDFCFHAAAAGWTDEAIIAAIQARIAECPIDKRIHSDNYIRNETNERALTRSIRGARERLKHSDVPALGTPEIEYLPLPIAEQKLDVVMREFFTADDPKTTVLKITTGAGKTHAMVKHLRKFVGNTAIFSATHNQAREIESTLNDWALPQAVRIRGRSQCDSVDEMPLCPRAEEIEAAHQAGIHNIAGMFCHTTWTDEQGNERSERCPFFESCGYYAQFKGIESVRILPHEFLCRETASAFTWANSRWIKGVDRIVIDESPINTLLGGHRSFSLDELPDKLPLLKRAIMAIKAGDPVTISKRDLREERLTHCQDTTPDISPATPKSLIDQALKGYQRNPLSRFDGLYFSLLAYMAGQTNLIWFGNDRGFYTYKRQSKLLDKYPALILDASADELIYKAFLGDDIRFIEINVRENLDIVQIQNMPVGRCRLNADDLLPQVCAFAHSVGGALISNKSAIDEARGLGWLDGMPHAHFNALRGLNSLEHAHTLVVCGRPEPDALAVESMARAIWPDQQLTLPGHYSRMMSGAGAVNAHVDPRANAVLRAIRDEEIEQAKGRLRSCRSSVTKRLYVLSNVPVRAERIKFVGIEELLPDRRLALALLRHGGTLPLNPTWLHANCPDLFGNEAQAKKWAQRLAIKPWDAPAGLKGTFPYEGYIHRRLSPLSFRLSGQKGQPARAISWHDKKRTIQTLERQCNRPVIFCDLPETSPRAAEPLHVLSTQWGEVAVDPRRPAFPQARALLCLFGLNPAAIERTLTRSERGSLIAGKPPALRAFAFRAIERGRGKSEGEQIIERLQRIHEAA